MLKLLKGDTNNKSSSSTQMRAALEDTSYLDKMYSDWMDEDVK